MGKKKEMSQVLAMMVNLQSQTKPLMGKPSIGPKITFIKGKTQVQKGKDKVVPDSQEFHASNSKAPIVTCCFCRLKGHINLSAKRD